MRSAASIARALGGRRRDDADALVLHSIITHLSFGVLTTVLFLAFGRALYGAMGASGKSLEAALTYSNIVFGFSIVVWLANALVCIIRGTGNMLVPSLAVCAGVVLLVPLSPLLIYGYGPLPGMGIEGAGFAVLIVNALTGLIAAAYIFSDACIVGFRYVSLRWALFADILRVGAIATFNVLQTNLTIALATGLVGMSAGADGVAGYGTGARLEYLLIPLAFGFGGPLIALVGTNMGAGQKERALRAALMGSGIAFAITEAVGIAGAIWPAAWLTLFGADPRMLEIGSAYLRIVGPTYGFFGLGMALYFASQGAGRMLWLLIPGTLRVIVAVGGGYLALHLTGAVSWLFAAQALALVLYGGIIFGAVKGGIWFTKTKSAV